MDGTIAELRLFAGNFAPGGWMLCNGQTLNINSNQALFSLLGTTYGGNGQTTFALPDLRGRVPIGFGPGLSTYTIGQKSGTESVTLLPSNLPPHNHALTGNINMLTTASPANAEHPSGNYFANDGSSKYSVQNTGAQMKPLNVNLVTSSVGNTQALDNRMPFLGITYIICVNGIFPVRN